VVNTQQTLANVGAGGVLVAAATQFSDVRIKGGLVAAGIVLIVLRSIVASIKELREHEKELNGE
jgi:energy-converting hydrogenase Eha subunit C